jgi:hypothetical protein
VEGLGISRRSSSLAKGAAVFDAQFAAGVLARCPTSRAAKFTPGRQLTRPNGVTRCRAFEVRTQFFKSYFFHQRGQIYSGTPASLIHCEEESMTETRKAAVEQLPEPPTERILVETDALIELTVGDTTWRTANGQFILEEDFRVAGEVWRVYKGDADPYPSKPHAHCISGANRFVGCKLHLGTGELFKGSKPLGRYLHRKQFDALIELIRPKFPGLTLPLRA